MQRMAGLLLAAALLVAGIHAAARADAIASALASVR